MLERREIENYLYDREVLEKYCTQHSLHFDADGYREFVTDIQNQNVKDNAAKIKTICSINPNFGTEKLNFQLAEFVTAETNIFAELEKVIFSSH